jgi:hypothetical protein
MIRLFIAPLGTKEQIVHTLEQVRTDAQEMLRFGGAVKQEFLEGRAALQDQAYIRALAVDFFGEPASHGRWLARADPRASGESLSHSLIFREERPRARNLRKPAGADPT